MSKFEVNIFSEDDFRVVNSAKKARALLQQAQATGTPAYARPISWMSSEHLMCNKAFRADIAQRRAATTRRVAELRQRIAAGVFCCEVEETVLCTRLDMVSIDVHIVDPNTGEVIC